MRHALVLCTPLLITMVAAPAMAYENEYDFPHTMVGPGTAACSDAFENEVGSDFGGTGIAPGTFGAHRMTLTETDLNELHIDLTFVAVAGAQMALYLLPPGAEREDCDDAIATTTSGTSPLHLTAHDLPSTGAYTLRVELDGIAVDGYHVSVWTA